MSTLTSPKLESIRKQYGSELTAPASYGNLYRLWKLDREFNREFNRLYKESR